MILAHRALFSKYSRCRMEAPPRCTKDNRETTRRFGGVSTPLTPREVEDSDVEDWDTLMLPQEVVLPSRTEPEEMVSQEIVLPPRQASYAPEGDQDRGGQLANQRRPRKANTAVMLDRSDA